MVAYKQARDIVTRQYNVAQNKVTYCRKQQYRARFGPFYRGHKQRKHRNEHKEEEQTGI